MEEQRLRFECLRLARELAVQGSSTEDVLKMAAAFSDWVFDKTS